MPEGCDEKCECTIDGEVKCEDLSCGDNAYCGIGGENKYGCHCYDGYELNNQNECELGK